MNFLPARWQHRQMNTRLLRRGLSASALIAVSLGLGLLAMVGANHWLETRISGYRATAATIDELMDNRREMENQLRSLIQVEGELRDLQSLATLEMDLALLSETLPHRAALTRFSARPHERDGSVLYLEGKMDSFSGLNNWLEQLRSVERVRDVRLIASDTLALENGARLEQRFEVELQLDAGGQS